MNIAQGKALEKSARSAMEAYRTERDRAHAVAIESSIKARLKSATPVLCDGGYEVLDR